MLCTFPPDQTNRPPGAGFLLLILRMCINITSPVVTVAENFYNLTAKNLTDAVQNLQSLWDTIVSASEVD